MGRYYNGDIYGKFWFGIQSSDDASELGVRLQLVYRFYGCGCEYEHDDKKKTTQNIKNKDYCLSCYDSYEDHRCDIENSEDTLDTEEATNGNVWYLSENEIYYQFQEENIPFLQKVIQELEGVVGKYMDSFRFVENAEQFEYEYTIPPSFKEDFKEKTKEEKRSTLELLARICLAKQILCCIETQDHCSFYAET
jgi:hypothetical protein